MTTRWAKVKTQFTFLHKYPAAPPQVGFLRDLHRHKFHVTVMIEQHHDHRDIEYLMFLAEVEKFIADYKGSWDSTLSCESIALNIGTYLIENYPDRASTVEVSEDGENGAVLEFHHG